MTASPERLRPLDMSLLAREAANAPMHVVTLDLFDETGDGAEYERLLALIGDRLAFVPRFRQRVRQLPGRLANPVWVDDEEFELAYHVRRSALPRPGSMDQLRDLVARIASRRLDRTRPLWETYLVEGLQGGRFAVLSKSHHALVDGTTVDLGQLILDDRPEIPLTPEIPWQPERPPGGLDLLADAVASAVRNPTVAVDQLRGSVVTWRHAADRARALGVSLLTGDPGQPPEPLAATLSEQRRFVTVDTALADYRTVRAAAGGSVNDVILATIAGALRAWLMTRGQPATGSTRIRALVPMSVVDDEYAEPTSLGSQVTPHLLTLPVTEPSPLLRLHQVSYAFKAHRETGRAVSAAKLAEIAGFAPTTFHALGSRVAASHPARSYELAITNVPGPQFPLYAAGARMRASYPVLPLVPGHALAVGVTSYDGFVYYGLNGDRAALPDIDVLASCLNEALAELVDAATTQRLRAPRGRTPDPATS